MKLALTALARMPRELPRYVQHLALLVPMIRLPVLHSSHSASLAWLVNSVTRQVKSKPVEIVTLDLSA